MNEWQLAVHRCQERTYRIVPTSGHSPKLRVDFSPPASMCAGMSHADDDSRSELIQQLLLEAGRLMEDASPDFAVALPDAVECIEARIALLEAVASDLQSLAVAARALLRPSYRPG